MTTNLLRAIWIAWVILIMSSQIQSSNAAASTAAPIDTLLTSHKITVSIDISSLTITGRDIITFNAKTHTESLRLVIRSGSSIDAVSADGKPLRFAVKKIASKGLIEAVIKLPSTVRPSKDATLTITVDFHGTFSPINSAREKIKRGVAFVDDGVIGDEGVFLPSGTAWFPRSEDGMAVYDAAISLPEAYTTVMEGTLIKRVTSGRIKTEQWQTQYPSDGLNLVAGRYAVAKETYKGLDIYTFFFDKDDALSRIYIDKTKEYLDMYDKLIGPYPFKKFAVVESFLPTGYGMASFTLLGSAVIRLPFIPETSLGHEIAHNWWGNSVYQSDNGGNWTEALTTFTADYLYAEKKGEGRDFRFLKLLGYKNFAETTPLTLAGFNDATEPVSRAVGYNKGAMLFVMLKDEIGEEAFSTGIKTFYSGFAFKRAAWADIQASFEAASGRKLGWFFDQWLNRPGGPAIFLEGPVLKWTFGQKYLIQFTIRQTNPATMTLPVSIETKDGVVRLSLRVTKDLETISVEMPALPIAFEIDPDYEVFRILSDAEAPPALSACFGNKDAVIILPSQKEAADKYGPVAALISKDYGASIVTDDTPEAYADKTIFVLGNESENKAYEDVKANLSRDVSIDDKMLTLAKGRYALAGNLFAFALKDISGKRRAICAFFGDAPKEKVLETGKRLRYFGESSYLVFNEGASPVKGRFSGTKILRHEF